jgi:hypothetical protein
MPQQESHRMMLFEKIEYMIMDTIRKRDEDISRSSDKEVLLEMIDKDKKYEKIIRDIKKLYPIKLRAMVNGVFKSTI